MKKKYGVLIILAAAFLISCTSDDDENPIDKTPDEPMNITATFLAAGTPLSLSTEYSAGQTLVKFSRIDIYLSQFSLENEVNTLFPAQPKAVYLMRTGETNSWMNNEIPIAEYITARLSIGLSESLNHADPTMAVPPLDLPAMHWGWNPDEGYKFAVLEGQYDSNNDGSISTADENFVYHCATDESFRSLDIPVSDGSFGDREVTILIDILALFADVDIPTTPSQHGSGETNTTIMDNFLTAVTLNR